ncbi:ty3-gypsy retrotransposon protein [Cucumis melo var. makuwa]|uniref:Ty3-gypsy retrotransposon protein n=1 Tax=Cucumis melo var. makuwa TaxID=1194695 RepID=A0A5A7VIJ4_CUCMM|nr:ty3-gypsy retrotransposon protein [Cucumis melo var. makuwa]TYK15216.1 ty3-gypsy retrotransposon protein [Cucumis melo var. makuwa]
MKLSIVSRGTKDFPVPEVRKDKKETKGAEKIVKSTVKEFMVELILRLAHEKKIELDLEEVAQINHVVVTIMSEAPSSRLILQPIVQASSSSAPTTAYETTPYCMSIDFSDEDLLLGSKLHNKPLYVSGYVREQRVDWILIDNASAVNIMSKSIMSQGSLKVKRHDVILTNPKKEGSEQEEGETSCHHITIVEELEIETPEEDAEDVPQGLNDGGQSTVDELKEVNLGTIEELNPTFISASLSSKESLLTEYRNIFAWSYKKCQDWI